MQQEQSKVDRDLTELVEQVAKSYARRCWWTDVAELRQVAWTIALKVRANYDATKAPRGIKPYARRALGLQITRYLLANTSPVSSSDHARYNLIGLTRAPLKTTLRDTKNTPEDKLVFERWRARVTVRLREVTSPEVMELLLDNPTRRLTKRAREAMNKIKSDAELRRLWEDRT